MTGARSNAISVHGRSVHRGAVAAVGRSVPGAQLRGNNAR